MGYDCGRQPSTYVTGRLRDRIEAVRRAHEAERRQLTVLFCDLVGSTMLSGQLDPEDLRAVVRAYQETAAVVIQRYEGILRNTSGMLRLLGYPQAHEDDAQRAVHTGVGTRRGHRGLNTRLEASYGVQLAVRLGTRDRWSSETSVAGAGTSNWPWAKRPTLRPRLEGLAAPNTVVISPVTARLVRQTFVLEDLGASALKGVAEPMTVWRVLGRRTPSPHDDEATPNRAPFLVGRDEELGLLRRRWEQSKEGLGQVVLLSARRALANPPGGGAPGPGRGEGYARLTLRCSPYYTNSALYPVIEHLQQVLQFERTDPLKRNWPSWSRGSRPVVCPVKRLCPCLAPCWPCRSPQNAMRPATCPHNSSGNRPRMRWWPGCWRKPPGSRCWPCGKTCTGPIPRPRAAGAAGRADPDRRHAARAHVPPGVFPALADALASDAHHAQPPGTPAGGGADCAPGGRQGAAGRGGGAHCGQDGWRAVVSSKS